MRYLREIAGLLPGLLLVCACQTAPEAVLSSPMVQGQVVYFPGSPLSGPVIMDPGSLNPEEALRLDLTLEALESLPSDVLEPLGPKTRLITSFRNGNPVAHVARLAAGARVGYLEDAGRFVQRVEAGEWGPSCPVDACTASLFKGTTTVFRFAETGDEPRTVEIQAHWRPGDFLEVVLTLEDVVVLEEPALTKDETEQVLEAVPYREVLLLDAHPLADRHQLALVFRSPFMSSRAKALTAVLDVQVATDRSAGVIAQGLEELKMAAAEASSRPGTAALKRLELPGLFSALEQFISATSTPLERRRALVYLAGRARAPLAEDIVLAAPDEVVDHLGTTVLDRVAGGTVESEEALVWALERAAYELLVRLKADKETGPGLEGMLVQYTGEVGRHAAIFEEVVAAAEDWNDLQASLVNENLIYLEDISPAARSRAFEWLAARNLAPQGYDPLASLKARRAALDRAAAEEEGNP